MHLVTINTPMGRMPTILDSRINMGGEAALPDNPDYVHTSKRKIKDSERPKYTSTGDYKCTSTRPRIDLRWVCKIIT